MIRSGCLLSHLCDKNQAVVENERLTPAKSSMRFSTLIIRDVNGKCCQKISQSIILSIIIISSGHVMERGMSSWIRCVPLRVPSKIGWKNQPQQFSIANRLKRWERAKNAGLMVENASKGGNDLLLLIRSGYFCVSWLCVPLAPNRPAGLRSLMTSSSVFQPSGKYGPIVPMGVNLLIMCANGVVLSLRSSALPPISVDFKSNRNAGSLNVRLVGSIGGVA